MHYKLFSFLQQIKLKGISFHGWNPSPKRAMREIMTALYQMHREKKHRKIEVAENTLIYRFQPSETRYKDIDTCFCMHFPISKESKGFKPGMLRNIAFDTYWYEFLGSSHTFLKGIDEEQQNVNSVQEWTLYDYLKPQSFYLTIHIQKICLLSQYSIQNACTTETKKAC